MTCFVNDGVSIGVLLQIVSIFQTQVNSRARLVVFTPSLTASSLHVWYLRKGVCFSFSVQITCTWERHWPSGFSGKLNSQSCYFLKREKPCLSVLREFALYGYTHTWYAAIRKSVQLKANVYFHVAPSARPVFQPNSERPSPSLSFFSCSFPALFSRSIECTSYNPNQHTLSVISD